MLWDWIHHHPLEGQILFGFLLVGSAWILFRPRTPESGFKLREADRVKTPAIRGQKLLPGIRIDGPAHEILGVAENASAAEIQKAYRDLMKQYHPDRIGRPDSPEWKEAQKIAEAINRARDQLLSKSQN